MIRPFKLTPRQILIVLHDVLATAAAVVATFFVRFEGSALNERLQGLILFLPFFLIYAAVVYLVLGLHRNKWRFTSVPDLYNLFRASTVLAISLLALDYVLVAPNIYGTFFFGKLTILLYWFMQMFFLGGLRVVYRYLHYRRTVQRAKVADATPTLVLGRAADAEVLLRGIESGAVKKIWPVGVLSPSVADRGQSIRGISVLGDIDDLESTVADLESRGTRGDAARPGALGAYPRGAARGDFDARTAAWSEHQPVAITRRRRARRSVGAGCGRGPAAPPQRQD